MIQDSFPGLDLYCTDPAQYLITAGLHPGDLDHDLCDISIRHVKSSNIGQIDQIDHDLQ